MPSATASNRTPNPAASSCGRNARTARSPLEVCDNGAGLPKDGPAEEGVGLSNTRARLRTLYGEAHGFELRDAPGGGLLVRLIIPFRTADSAAMKIRTLIVDDEPLARDRLRQLLQDEPEIEIIGECADGREAVAAMGKTPPELVFLDVQMPELDGFGVLEAVGTGPPPVIVFVTAHDRFALRAFEVHAVDYLLKPFDRERFQKALRRAVEQVRNRDSAAIRQRQSALLADLANVPTGCEIRRPCRLGQAG